MEEGGRQEGTICTMQQASAISSYIALQTWYRGRRQEGTICSKPLLIAPKLLFKHGRGWETGGDVEKYVLFNNQE